MKKLVLFLLVLSISACGDSQPIDREKTLALGKFRLTGSAENGQYARQLFKVNRLLISEVAQKEGWQVMETERISELLEELDLKTEESGLMDNLVNKLSEEITGEKIKKSSPKLPMADYLLVGEMDGFDIYYDESAQSINGVVRALNSRARKVRSNISFRIVDVKNRKWLYSQSRSFDVRIPDEGGAESQIDNALRVMVKSVVNAMDAKLVDEAVSPENKQMNSLAPKVSSMAPIKIAFGGFSSATNKKIKGAVLSELESMIMHRLQKESGLKVLDQSMGRIKKLLAQQVLTDLSKGRQPGLPMGTLKGVDYLAFGEVHELKIETSKLRKIESLDLVAGGKAKKARARLHLYLQDVNTGENVLSEELVVNLELKDIEKEDIDIKLFSHISDSLIGLLLTSIRPLEVVWSEAGYVVLNHGKAAGLKVGDVLEVFSLGSNRIDPYTGSVMQGIGSRKISDIKIIKFSPSGYAEGEILQGTGVLPGQKVMFKGELEVSEVSAKKVVKKAMKLAW